MRDFLTEKNPTQKLGWSLSLMFENRRLLFEFEFERNSLSLMFDCLSLSLNSLVIVWRIFLRFLYREDHGVRSLQQVYHNGKCVFRKFMDRGEATMRFAVADHLTSDQDFCVVQRSAKLNRRGLGTHSVF